MYFQHEFLIEFKNVCNSFMYSLKNQILELSLILVGTGNPKSDLDHCLI